MARLLGTDMSTWGIYEAGLQRIPADQALKLSAYGIPLEWVYQKRWPTCTRTSEPKSRAWKLRSLRLGHARQKAPPKRG